VIDLYAFWEDKSMKTESSLVRILWSLTYLVLIVVVLRGVLVPKPARVNATAPQDQRKSLEEAFAANPQVRVTTIKVGTKERRFKDAFEESDDWLRKLSFEIQSGAPKPIVYLEMNLNFPETKSSGSMMSFPLKLGVRPDIKTANNNKPLLLMPGDKLNIPVSEYYDKLERFLGTRHAMNQIRKAQIEVGFIIFEDGTAWAGEFMRPDPYQPGRYLPVGSQPQN
jgi:hypothetical protein